MDERSLRKSLLNLPLGGLRYFEQASSTNDLALAWATAGAPNLALVYAEEQTAGRGRGSRRWFTPKGAGLAFSLVLRPFPGEEQSIALFSALGALAVCEALSAQGLQPEIKWPNDVLLNGRKTGGILAESVWMGDTVESIVLGVGLNVTLDAIPPADQLLFPATCLEAEALRLQHPDQVFEPAMLLQQIIQAVIYWRGQVARNIFLHAWESRLAFRGELVEIRVDGQAVRKGTLDGLEPDGSLRLLSPQGGFFTAQFGEVHLRPVV
jgi:BirA family transcriptional regulator, biotin operon repressor / biotin---[acetyl-CoA-carboxylase] ligase